MSDQVAIGTPRGYGSMTEAESRLVYQADKPVTVYYDPKSPADAVLEPGATGGVWGTFFIAAGFFLYRYFITRNNGFLIAACLLLLAMRTLSRDEASRMSRAKAAGESVAS